MKAITDHSTVSRRAFILSASAVAISSNAAAAPEKDDRLDADLIELGRHLLALEDQLAPLDRRIQEGETAFAASPEYRRIACTERWWAARVDCGLTDELVDAQWAVLDRIIAVENEIMTIQPKTAVGLAVHAAVVREVCSALWEEPEIDQDWDKVVVRRLVDQCLNLGERLSQETGGVQ